MSDNHREVQFFNAQAAFSESVKGWVFFPFHAEAMPFDQVDGTSFHLVKSNPGEIRGNHLHPGVEEWLHVFGGPAVFYWREADGAVQRKNIDNDFTVIRVSEGVPHALSNPGPGPVYLVAFRTEPPEPGLPAAEPAEIV